ncbi:patatin family protein [Paenibacillus sp. LHD-117]|uniref:patatin-like phospholipase family protein n=1 Tax=Paenibacillus sp. LHD-117 TaxID=3071412 RepID=UPI0027DF3914|nr:patatin family protein [Paenibacillus sp. LHD-117]MDQ6422396.1 patatin family protein [Paenibacillus sp. LHD-117]
MAETIGLVLEGGGMRAVYTAGVLECLMEHDLYFPYNIGVSAGACMGASYLSRQAGRNLTVNVDYVSDPRYISWSNLWKKREMFGMDFIFDEIPNRLVPFDYGAFEASAERYVVGTTDCETGESVYYERGEPGFDLLTLLRASSSLPFIARIVEFGGRKLLDGGLSDPIPLRKAEKDGNARNILILTRNESYRKSPNRMAWMVRRAYGNYPKLVETMLRRHEVYNETLAYIAEQERRGAAFIIRPTETLSVGRMERDPKKLGALYEQGYEDAKRTLPELKAWMG